MKLEDIGERGLIERICRDFVTNKAVMIGAGEDDSAVIDISAMGVGGEGEGCIVITTDMLRESTHFPEGISPFQIGWTVVAVNLSDIAAMGATPFAMTIAMGIPKDTEVAFMDEIVKGARECASCYHTYIVGGDTMSSEELTFTGTCIGFAAKGKILRRRGARVGDVVCVTGTLGKAALGMKIIEGEVEVPREVEEEAKRALFQPEPRVREGIFLANTGKITSMMDISDGLALSLVEIGRKSGVGFEIYEDRVPVMEELRELDIDLRE
ncbi:MAG: thiamine-phosphate kinase, partial [Candidatus Methanospirareceae archaeon]